MIPMPIHPPFILLFPSSYILSFLLSQIIMDHLSVFEKNGFFIDVDRTAMPMQRVMVKSLPFSKRTQVFSVLTFLFFLEERTRGGLAGLFFLCWGKI